MPPRNRLVHLLPQARLRHEPRNIAAALVQAQLVDPVSPLCHSARITSRASASDPPLSCTPRHASRRTRSRIQSPSATARALNPAVQSN